MRSVLAPGSATSGRSGVRLGQSGRRRNGSNMNNRDILNVFEALLRASGHPGIKLVEPYGPGVGGFEGVKIRFEWDGAYSWAYLFTDGNERKPAPQPFTDTVPLAHVPDSKGGTVEKWLLLDYTLKLVHDLCETTRPEPFTSWTPIGLDDVGHGHGPVALAITCTDGTRQVLRATIGSGPTGDPKADPWPDYSIPTEEVKQWSKHLKATPKEPAKL
jgi:hypothetical protein